LVQVLGYVADAMWILALAIMAGASRQAWARIPAGAAVPVALGPDGGTILSAGRLAALCAVPVLAFVLGCALAVARIWTDHNALAAIALFLVRASLAPLLATAHLRWLRLALDRTQAARTLRP
jgi:predicted permease